MPRRPASAKSTTGADDAAHEASDDAVANAEAQGRERDRLETLRARLKNKFH